MKDAPHLRLVGRHGGFCCNTDIGNESARAGTTENSSAAVRAHNFMANPPGTIDRECYTRSVAMNQQNCNFAPCSPAPLLTYFQNAIAADATRQKGRTLR